MKEIGPIKPSVKKVRLSTSGRVMLSYRSLVIAVSFPGIVLTSDFRNRDGNKATQKHQDSRGK